MTTGRASVSDDALLCRAGDDACGQRRVVEALAAKLHAADPSLRVIETHISFVLLTGRFAYKIKKAVTLPFLDFATLAARRRACEDELRLNRRLAPRLYLDVVPIAGARDAPTLAGGGSVLDYAVRMRRFPDDALLSDVLARNALTPTHVDALAAAVARFHAQAGVARDDSPHGDPDEILALALDNFAAVAPIVDDAAQAADVEALRSFTRREHAAIRPTLERRRRDGAIRECHGDLHLRNVALFEGELAVFDCIEFSETMRWIDVMSEVAFTMMDFEHRGRRDFAYRFVNAYCEASGDYDGLRVLRYYVVYRAMVRAKVACLRAAQVAEAERAPLMEGVASHLRLALAYAHTPQPALGLMHGASGCGKTTLAGVLVERAGAIRVRSDVERKRLVGLAATAQSGSPLAAGLYGANATRRTYEHLRDCAASVLAGGFAVLVDATSQKRAQRDLFRDLAQRLAAPFVIVDCVASPAALHARVSARARRGDDASEADVAVLAHQLSTADPLSTDERRDTIACNTGMPFDALPARAWQHLVERLNAPAAPPGPSGGAPLDDEVLARRVQFLALPTAFGPANGTVEVVETARSWVFLTDDHAYRLEKPRCDGRIDLRAVGARHHHGEEALRVNRRFSTDVYLDLVALAQDDDAALHLGDAGVIVDWLVRMRRLPADCMLDRAIAAGRFEPASLVGVVEAVCRAHGQAPVRMDERVHRQRLGDRIDRLERDLLDAAPALEREVVKRIANEQRRRLDLSDLGERVRHGRIVEGHGDLRPEHVCLGATPQIIGALGDSREQRILDALDDLGFLALECERRGAPQAARVIFVTYRRCTGDAAPQPLVDFYQCLRALACAHVAVRSLHDDVRAATRANTLARHYLELAAARGRGR